LLYIYQAVIFSRPPTAIEEEYFGYVVGGVVFFVGVLFSF
jgi:hypothetical protein